MTWPFNFSLGLPSGGTTTRNFHSAVWHTEIKQLFGRFLPKMPLLWSGMADKRCRFLLNVRVGMWKRNGNQSHRGVLLSPEALAKFRVPEFIVLR